MSEPIRVLQVFAQMNRGGAETMIMNLYRNIDRTKVQFDFIVHTNEKCAFDDEIMSLGGHIYRVPRYTGKNHFQYKKAWQEFFKKHPEYKIIHGHVRSTASIYLKIAKKYGLTTIAHSHNTSSGTGFSAAVKNLMQYPIRYTADHLFACSMSAGKWLFGEKALKKENFHILKNAIDTKKFIFNKSIRAEKRQELQVGNRFLIGHVGRFHPQKNHDFLVNVFKEIHDRNKNAVLLLVGDGELRESIKNKVDDLGLTDNVIFTGVRSDVPELFQAMDVFLFPSNYEGLGIVVVEAQAAGLPCVVADTIPVEAFISDLVTELSLTQSKIDWAMSVLEHVNEKEYERPNTMNLIKNKGYDILDTSKKIEQFYLNIALN